MPIDRICADVLRVEARRRDEAEEIRKASKAK